MNKAIFKVGMFIGLAIISTVVSANAQSISQGRAEVPFDFTVGGTTFTAGRYLISINDGKFVSIADRKGKSVLTSVLMPKSFVTGIAGTRLVFDRIADQYFLSSIDSSSFNLKLQRSKLERDMAENLGMPTKTVSLRTK